MENLSINYTLLNKKRIHDDEKKMFTYPVELTIRLNIIKNCLNIILLNVIKHFM